MTARLLAVSLLLAGLSGAQQSAYTNAGGTISLGSDLTISGSATGSPAGTFSLDCPVTALPPGTYSAEWVCNGGTVTIQSTDGLTTVNGNITSGTLVETASGGGRGGNLVYYYSFSGSFKGTMTVSGQAVAVIGMTSQSTSSKSTLGSAALAGGTTHVNAEYEPVYITDTYNYRIVRIDDILGDNLRTVGSYGSGTKQFGLPWGLALDAVQRIYVTDSANCRVVRMNNISGAGWTTLGACGSGNLQFNNPAGIAVDSSGRIYVADAGNNRIVRFNGITGGSWTVLGTAGSGTNQFSQPSGIAVDASGKIYVADQGNGRIVRMDNMTGANWTTFGSGGSGANQFYGAGAVSLDSSGRIYVADTYNNRIVRFDDMNGTNWTVLGGTTAVSFINPYGVSVDPYGTIYIADSRDYRIAMSDDMLGSFFTTYNTPTPGLDSPTTIVPAPPAGPIAVPALSATLLSFANTVVGTPSASQTVTMTNIGSAPLEISGITTGADFTQTNTCGAPVTAGESCAITIAFVPTASGNRPGAITVNFTSGPARTIGVRGLGTLLSVSPLSLNFGNVNAGFGGTSLPITVSNPGPAAAAISSITLSGSPVYRLKNGCSTSLAAGSSCTLTLWFFPQSAAIYAATVTVTDGSGTAQKVSVTGTGVSN